MASLNSMGPTPAGPNEGVHAPLLPHSFTGNRKRATSFNVRGLVKESSPGIRMAREITKYVIGLGLPVFGVLYLAGKTFTVRDGFVGITYNSGKLEIYPPGRFCLVKPTHHFARFLSIRQEVVTLAEIKFITTDNIPMRAQAVLTYQVVDPFKAIKNIDNVSQAIRDRAETILCGIFRSHSVSDLSPAAQQHHAQRAAQQSQQGNPASALEDQALAEGAERSAALVGRLTGQFMNEFQRSVEEWGVHVHGLQIMTIRPQGNEFIQGAIQAMTARQTANAARRVAHTNQETALINQETKRKQILIDADARAQALRVSGQAQVDLARLLNQAGELIQDPTAKQLMLLQGQKDVVAASAKTTLITGFGAQGVMGDEPFLVPKKPQHGAAMNGED